MVGLPIEPIGELEELLNLTFPKVIPASAL